MRVQLIANLAVNGELILAEQVNAYKAPAEIAGMGIATAIECGNIIIGTVTYHMFATAMKDVFANLEVVVLSSQGVGAMSLS